MQPDIAAVVNIADLRASIMHLLPLSVRAKTWKVCKSWHTAKTAHDETALVQLQMALENKYFRLVQATPPCRDETDVVLAVLRRDGRQLISASDRLRDTMEVVMVAVEEAGNALQFASSRLRDHIDCVLAAAASVQRRRLQSDEDGELHDAHTTGKLWSRCLARALRWASERLQSTDRSLVFLASARPDLCISSRRHRGEDVLAASDVAEAMRGHLVQSIGQPPCRLHIDYLLHICPYPPAGALPVRARGGE